MTKMTATVHVGFELLEGRADNMANTALIGGVGALKLAIERGVTGTGQTGVKTGTVQAGGHHAQKRSLILRGKPKFEEALDESLFRSQKRLI